MFLGYRNQLQRCIAWPSRFLLPCLHRAHTDVEQPRESRLRLFQAMPQGRDLLKSLAGPLTAYLKTRDEILMVSGFADDQQVHVGNHRFADNWELSAERALTVTRSFIDAGVPASSVFAAAFGSEQPVSANTDEAGRAKNRRVEIAPVPRPTVGESKHGQ